MLLDVLVVALIVIVAAVLGLTVHPVLWFVAIIAVLFLLSRGSRARSRNRVP